MRQMYDNGPSKLILKRKFEERVWKKYETFCKYVHHKIILANQVPIPENELIS